MASSLVGVSVLALIDIAAGVTTKARWLDRVLMAVVSAGLGLLILAVELAVHR